MSKPLIQFTHLYKSFGNLSLFEEISLSVSTGEVFALIGENGVGKTTLLRVLLGEIIPDAGSKIQAPDLTIGYLPQEILIQDPEQTVREFLRKGPLFELEEKIAFCLQVGQLEEWEELHEAYERLGGYLGEPLEKVMLGLEIQESLLNSEMRFLSGGQRVRIALAKALMQNPSLLLLDEPTNHLDERTIHWLVETLKNRKGASIIVSHDRMFLNNACNRLFEISGGKIHRYGGSYDYYLSEKERDVERKIQEYQAQQEERSELKQKIKAMTFSRGKASRPSDRNVMAYDRRGEFHQKSLQHKLNRLKARLAEIETNLLSHPKPKSIKGLYFESMPLIATTVIEIRGIYKSFGKKEVFSGFSQTITQGEKVILVGPNGCGKTTLLNCIAKVVPLDRGEIILASSAKIFYLDQEMEYLPQEQTVLQYFEKNYNLSLEKMLSELHKAALGGAELLHKKFAELSVGQRKRFMLLSMILEKPNILLLDEPTNHLDFTTLEAFEKMLLKFSGVLIAVSHDTTFVQKIATQKWELIVN